MIAEGEIRDANTLSAFARMTALGLDLTPCASRESFKFREGEENPEAVKPFLDHLEDLRWTLAKIAMTLGAGMAVAFLFRGTLVEIIQRPLRQVDPHAVSRLQVLSVTDPLMIVFELSFYAGIVITFPITLYFLAQFILPALSEKERKIILPGIALSVVLVRFRGARFAISRSCRKRSGSSSDSHSRWSGRRCGRSVITSASSPR